MLPIYIRENRIRSPEFQVETKIINDKNKKFVLKKALNDSGKIHIYKILEGYEKIKNSIIGNELKLPKIIETSENSIIFEYINGINYSNLIIENLSEGSNKGFEKFIFDYFNILKKNLKLNKYKKDDKFIEFFDDIDNELFKDEICLDLGIIDLIFENIIFSNNNYFIVDTEWVFENKVPFTFLIYRSLIYFYCKNRNYLEKFYSLDDLLRIFDIPKQKQIIYSNVEDKFQNYVFKEKLNSLKNNYLKKYIYLKDIKNTYDLQLNQEKPYAQLFFDIGRGFNEIDSERIYLDLQFKTQNLKFDLKNKKKILAMRLDPLNNPVVIEIKSVNLFTKKNKFELKDKIKSNAIVFYLDSASYFFETVDPQIYFDVDSNILKDAISIEFTINYSHFFDDALHTTAKQLSSERIYWLNQNEMKEQELNNLKQNLEFRNGEILQKNNELEELSRSINDREVIINELKKEINDRDNDIRQKQEKIEELSRSINDREGIINELKNEIKNRDNEIAQRNIKINELNICIKNKDEEIEIKNSILKDLKNSIDSKNNKITELNNIIANKDNEIKQNQEKINELYNYIKEKENVISDKLNLINELNNLINLKDNEIKQKEDLINQLNIRIFSLEEEVVGYVTSKSWKITRPLRKIKRFLKRILGKKL